MTSFLADNERNFDGAAFCAVTLTTQYMTIRTNEQTGITAALQSAFRNLNSCTCKSGSRVKVTTVSPTQKDEHPKQGDLHL
jgi:hypothetical protein